VSTYSRVTVWPEQPWTAWPGHHSGSVLPSGHFIAGGPWIVCDWHRRWVLPLHLFGSHGDVCIGWWGVNFIAPQLAPCVVCFRSGFSLNLRVTFVCAFCDGPSGDRPTSLAGDLARLLNNPARSDVTFIVENRPIYGHRCVIMVRCEPLAAMLDGCMRESQQEEIVLPDQRYHVFLAFLEFLYTDRVQVMDPLTESVEFAMDLLSVADQYMVDQLKK
jgi:hypothetical protein